MPIPLRRALLAGDGGRYVLVAHHPSPKDGAAPPRCRLDVVDSIDASVVHSHTVCAPHEEIRQLLMEQTSTGPIAYLGIGDVGPTDAQHKRDRVVAVHANTGAVLRTLPLVSPSEHLLLAAAPERSGSRLYVVEGTPGAENEYTVLGRWRLLGIDPATFEIEREIPVRVMLRALTVAPDGDHAYALPAGGTKLLHLDLLTGALHPLASFPAASVSLVAITRHVYVPDPVGDQVWIVDRRHPDRLRTVNVGRHPTSIVMPAPESRR